MSEQKQLLYCEKKMKLNRTIENKMESVGRGIYCFHKIKKNLYVLNIKIPVTLFFYFCFTSGGQVEI